MGETRSGGAIEIVKKRLDDPRDNLPTEAVVAIRLVGQDKRAGFPHRGNDGDLVERHQCPRINDTVTAWRSTRSINTTSDWSFKRYI